MALFNMLIHFNNNKFGKHLCRKGQTPRNWKWFISNGSKVCIKPPKVKHFELPVQLDGTQIDFCIHDMTTAEVRN